MPVITKQNRKNGWDSKLWLNSASPFFSVELTALRGSIEDSGFTAHNHYLAGWLLSRLPAAPCDDALDHFNRGIALDKLYSPNYLNAGHVFRLKKQDLR